MKFTHSAVIVLSSIAASGFPSVSAVPAVDPNVFEVPEGPELDAFLSHETILDRAFADYMNGEDKAENTFSVASIRREQAADRVCVRNAGTWDTRWTSTDLAQNRRVAAHDSWYGWSSTVNKCDNINSDSTGEIRTNIRINGAPDRSMRGLYYRAGAGTMQYRCTGNLFSGSSCREETRTVAIPLEDGPAGYWRGGNLQHPLSCGSGEIMTGFCGYSIEGNDIFNPGNSVACIVNGQMFESAIHCSRSPSSTLVWHDSNSATHTINVRGANLYGSCNEGSVMTGHTVNDYSDATLRCTTASDSAAVRLDPQDTVSVCKRVGEAAVCPEGYVATSMCSSLGFPSLIGHHCGQDICSRSGLGDATAFGMECTRIAGYEFHDVVSAKPDEEGGTFQVQNCRDNYFGAHPADRQYTLTNRVQYTTSTRTTTEQTNTNGESITNKLNTSLKIGLTAGVAKVGIQKTMNSEISTAYEAVTTMETRSHNVHEVFESTEREQTFTITTDLLAGSSWRLLHFGAIVNGAADYVVEYLEHGPGRAQPKVVREDVRIGTSDLNERNWMLDLSSDVIDADYLRIASCETIAYDYLSQTGPFSDATLKVVSAEEIEGATTVVGDLSAIDEGRRVRARRGLRGSSKNAAF